MSSERETKFKETEIGKIPEDWEVKKVKEIAKSMADAPFGTSLKNKDYTNSGALVLQGKNIQGRTCDWSDKRFVSLEKYSSLQRSHCFLGDIIFPKVGTIGKVGILTKYKNQKYYLLSTNTMKLSSNPEIADRDYVYYYFSRKKVQKYIEKINSKSVQPVFNYTTLKNFNIILPPLEEQKTIAKILSDLDDKIELNNQMNKNLEAIGQALFKRWFVDFEFPNEDGEPYKSSGGERVYNDELDKEIPKGWKVGKLSETLVELESGSRPKGGIKECDDGVPSIGAENILGLGKYNYSKTKYIPRSFFGAMKKGIIKSGDVLLYKDGAQLGRKSIFMCNFPFRECCINEHVFILRTKNSFSQIFLYFWLDQTWMTEEIKNLNANSAQPGINKKGVNSLTILIPPHDILYKFDKIINSSIEKIFQNSLENRRISKIRDTLLPKLMSGEVRVNTAEVIS